jgi:hypothetical protein
MSIIAEREGRQHQAAQVRARDRQPAELEREEEQQHQAEPEMRDRDAEHGDHHGADIDQGAAPVGREEAQAEAQDHGDHQAGGGQHQGRRKAGQQDVQDRLVAHDRAAEIALQQPAHVHRVLDVDRLIEPQVGADRLELLGRGLELGVHDPHRIARHGVDQQGDGDGRDPDGEDRGHDPLQEIAAHRRAHRVRRQHPRALPASRASA